MRLAGAFVFVAALYGTAAAQTITPGPPGPYVLDVRGAMTGVPQAASYYAAVPADTVVPARGFGAAIGVHVYPLRIGRARLGIGGSFVEVRGTATTSLPTTSTSSSSSSSTDSSSTPAVVYPDTTIWERIVAPELSVNFGTHDGWSYLSAGYGPVREKTDVVPPGSGTLTQVTNTSAANFGGGARWFLSAHLGIGFDVRFYRIPSATVVGLNAGFSVR
ncbi:MAG TPA: hypothetical protein VG871_02385 [Vicinamibacterales bacterium]|nr:hypothetical protein [Vicinamibacterales bacterium]